MPTVTDVFSDCCDSAGVRFKPMNVPHQRLSDAAYSAKGTKGICLALTLLWLSRYFKDLMPDDNFHGHSFGTLVSAVGQDKGLQMILRQIQQYEHSRGAMVGKGLTLLGDKSKLEAERLSGWDDIMQGMGFKAIFTEGMAALGVRPTHLRVHHCVEAHDSFCCRDDKPPYSHLCRFVTLYEGASLIKFQSHWVGAISDPLRPKFKFLDVNAGQAITDDKTKFMNFVGEFMSSLIARSYQNGKLPVFAVQAY